MAPMYIESPSQLLMVMDCKMILFHSYFQGYCLFGVFHDLKSDWLKAVLSMNSKLGLESGDI